MKGGVFLNGRYCSPEEALISVDDRGFLFGDGIYEVIRVFGGKMFKMKEHMDRLERSASKILLELPYGPEEITNICKKLLAESGIEKGLIYMQVSRGAAPRTHYFPKEVNPTFLVKVFEVDEDVVRKQLQGVEAILLPDDRWGHCDIKSVNLLPNVLARETAHRRGAYEAIFVHPLGITECGSSNVFAVINDKLVTAPLGDHILPGITREVALQLAEEAGLPIELRYPQQDEFVSAPEVFITNTLNNITPILAIDGKPVGDGNPGKITLMLQEKMEEMMKNHC